ncbi:DNA-binding MarR family transcriptional regulator [Tamaricihabitans halophyticus]|uniref:DNA-binding MarR family transcriptional regulator n=1 Tax=Tamaricihabitans halophyticus TaxID=1262583 RepID=A0A4R2R4D0_9PSEU|nr:MarR family transcriptional regulator [Tamaricihabitans halophyticus]TCP56548.1 DNA-binding MarR family transcriptional regulator [Tamaricihabitans halophyticus]
MSTEPEAGQSALVSRLRLAVVRLNRRLRAQRTTAAISLTQISAMSTLHKCGALSPRDLAARESVQPPSMTRVLAALEEAGYVSRTAHPTDGRQAIVALTDAGREYINADISAREAWLASQLDKLDESERETLSRAAEIIDRMAGQ